MTVELKTVISQLSIADGAWRRQVPNQIAVREPKHRRERGLAKGDLFILTEIQNAGERRDLLEKRVAEIIRDAYYTSPGSITASLRRAVQTAADWLFQYNATDTDEAAPLIGGVAVAAIRNNDAFLAQLGPAAIYVTMEDEVLRFPAQSAWLDMALGAEDTDEVALGLFHFVDPQLAHIRLSEGDLLVLADSQLAGQLPLEEVTQAILNRKVEVAARNLGSIAQSSNCSALAIEAVGRATAPEPTPVETASPPPPPQPAPAREPVAAGAGPAPQFQSALPALNIRQVARRAAQGTVGAALVLGHGLRVMGQRMLPDGEQRSAGGRRPSRQAGAQTHRTHEAPAQRWKTLLYIALGIPLLALLITGAMYLRQGRALTLRFNDSLALAQTKLQELQTADPVTARTLLNEAEAALAEARTVRPDAPEIAPLQQAIDEHRDQVTQTQRLYYLPQLRQYTDAGTQLRRVIVQGVDLYVLDQGTDRVFHHRLDEAGETLLADDANTLLLARDIRVEDAVVGEIVDMVWMPAGGGRQTSDLLILERDGLMEYNASWGVTTSAIGATDSWLAPAAVSSYFGNFYVLDPPANSIKRYLPTVDGYSAPPEEYFLPGVDANLAGAVDMAIDGDVYVLFDNGTIRKFRGGQAVEFSVKGLDAPLAAPTAIFTAPDDLVQYLYIADAGNQRIVQLTKEGDFVRQFKPRAGEAVVFDDLSGLFVDEIVGRMYILNGNSLYGATLPVQQ